MTPTLNPSLSFATSNDLTSHRSFQANQIQLSWIQPKYIYIYIFVYILYIYICIYIYYIYNISAPNKTRKPGRRPSRLTVLLGSNFPSSRPFHVVFWFQPVFFFRIFFGEVGKTKKKHLRKVFRGNGLVHDAICHQVWPN